jgi:hypothetical protein
MDSPSRVEKELNENLHDGPFGPVEYKSYINEVEEGYELFISHLKIHERYKRRGLGEETIINAVQTAYNSDLKLTKVSIDILGGQESADFMNSLGFNIVKQHGNQVSARAEPSEILS